MNCAVKIESFYIWQLKYKVNPVNYEINYFCLKINDDK
jgi:hypothetical protein